MEVCAKINGINDFNSHNFKFDTEKALEDKLQQTGGDNQNLDESKENEDKIDGGNVYGITN